MNQRKRHIIFPLAALAIGLAGAGLRGLLYRVALDSSGLLKRSHPLGIAVWLLFAVAVVLAITAGQGQWKHNRTPDRPRRQIFTGIGEILFGAAVYATVRMDTLPGFPALMPMRQIFGAVCMAAMIGAGMCHLFGKQVPFFCPAFAAVFFLLNTLASYPTWSRDPQLMDYAFTLLAEICLCLFSYYCCALSLGLPGRKQRLVVGVLGIFCCVAAIPGHYLLIHIAGIVYILTSLFSNNEVRL